MLGHQEILEESAVGNAEEIVEESFSQVEKIVDLTRQRAEELRLAAEVEQCQALERERAAAKRKENKAKNGALRGQMSEMGHEECVMALEDMKRELRREGVISATLRVLAKDSLAAQGEAAEKAAAKEVARERFV